MGRGDRALIRINGALTTVGPSPFEWRRRRKGLRMRMAAHRIFLVKKANSHFDPVSAAPRRKTVAPQQRLLRSATNKALKFCCA
jgi:hypothetical protein